VSLYAGLRQYAPDRDGAAGGGTAADPVPLEVEPGKTVADVLEHLGVPPEEARLVFVNRRAVEKDHILADGDSVGVFPPVAGG